MEWIERLNKTISYIEEHLTEEISYDELARIACCSTYHFQRMFAYMASIPLSEYIRRRRMSLAAIDLQNGNEKIIDIGIKYGYSSPTAFNRAFQSVHGIAPSMAKKEGTPMKSFPPISFKITVKGMKELNYRMEEKTAFRIVGVSHPLDQEVENNFVTVPKMWQNAAMNGTLEKITPLMNSQPMGVLGVSVCNDKEDWRYFIAVSSSADTGDSLEEYMDFLDTLPSGMKKEIAKASVCKRLINPEDCNPKCVMGYDFIMDKEHYQKCRYMAFMLTITEESTPYIIKLLEKET